MSEIFDFNSILSGLVCAALFEAVGLALLKFFSVFTIVEEGRSKVYVLFGEVELSLTEPGLHFLWPQLTWKALIFGFLGKVYDLDMRMSQTYLRSQPVNSEEGAPMGVGVWYETYIEDPVAYLFKNSDPEGSLQANVSNATVKCLSNLPLGKMLEDRHHLSQIVRTEVSGKSNEWGYKLGSVYIRKVHFRDHQMIQEIESKVVNRLKQVTASIRQDGDNQVRIITNTAQRAASVEFAKASALRPQIVGQLLSTIAKDQDVAHALFEVLETQKLLDNPGQLIFVPTGSPFLGTLPIESIK